MDTEKDCRFISFNSTLVQLKVEEVKRGQDDLIMFQFYLSSIKRTGRIRRH